ncbi:MAG TPA: GNAT family N-acetyltransferase [Acidimicrobiia bacterium]|nr:GNAT family N-acetyltransferase [Acidimicrobiia bacterium]
MIRPVRSEDIAAVSALLTAEGWGARAGPDRLAEAVDAATRAVVAEEDGEVVGFGRCVTDDVSNGYLSMVIVAPGHRGRGIGRAIVDTLTGTDPRISWVLRAGHPGSDGFWEAMGFRRSEIAYERERRA